MVDGMHAMEPGPAFDGLLVTLVQLGDRPATEALARRWQPRLLRTARRLVGAELAPGAVQEAWISILRGIGGLRDPQRFAPWAFGILRRRCADAIRGAQAERGRHALAVEEAGLAPGAPDDALAIAAAIAALPAE